MNVYKWGPKTFRAWSQMQCNDKEDHMPHSWTSEFTLYGPYMCWGKPERHEPNEADIRLLVGEATKGLAWLRPYMPEGSKAAKAFDRLERYANGQDT